MNYTRETESILLKLIIMLFIAFIVNCKKTKKRLPEAEDNSEDFNADIFCKKRSKLIEREKSNEIIIVDCAVNSAILLQCKYCEEKDNGFPKTWSRQKHIFTGNITEVETDTNDKFSTSSVFISKNHSLVFRSVQESDVGLYFCKAPYIGTPEKSFTYLIDFSVKCEDEVRGTLLDFKNYTKFYLERVNEQLTNKTFILQNLTIKMKVYTDWSEWSECDSCFRKEGIRYRFGRCRVKPVFQEVKEGAKMRTRLKGFVFRNKQNSERPDVEEGEVTNVSVGEDNILQFGLALSCRSCLLSQIAPDLYNITSVIPDFVMSEKCTVSCTDKSRKNGPRYRKSIILAKGAHLTLICPDSTIDSNIQWEHNKIRLHPNEGTDYIPGTIEPRQYVDSFNTLYLFEVTDKESGNYTCFVDGVRVQEVKIIVLTRSLFFTKEFTRHLKYLGFIFCICFFVYLLGIIIMCIKNHSEKVKVGKKTQRCKEDRKKLLSMDYNDSDSY